jgi:hypothetical protein
MIDEQAKVILKKAYSDCTREEIENLRWHLRNETPVLCGNDIPFRHQEFVRAGAG